MLPYLIAGLAVGALYALSTTALVITYNASRVFNFAQSGMAFFLAYVFYWMTVQHGLNPWLAAALTVFVAGPLLGLFLWRILLGRLTDMTPLTKVAVMIGVEVFLVALTTLIFGDEPVYNTNGPTGDPTTVFTIFDVNVSNDQVVVILAAIVVALAGYFILNRTTAGLVTRGTVDSTLMTTLTGTNPKVVVAASWMIGTGLAALAGIFLMPKVGLTSAGFANLVAASMAGAVIGKFTNLWRALAGAVSVGVLQEVLVPYLPSEGFLSTALRPSLPFLFMVIAILIYSRQGDVRAEEAKVEVAASTSSYEQSLSRYVSIMRNPRGRWDRWVGVVVLIVIAIAVPTFFNEYWIGLFALGLCYSVTFLSYRLVTGEAGILSLCQISFAGVGALCAGYVATNDTIFGNGLAGEVNIFLAMAVGAVCAGLLGAVVGFLCLPLGALYGAITTFAFALLVDQVVYTRPELDNYGSGLFFNRPEIFGTVLDTNVKYYWFAVAVVALFCVLLWSLRRGTTGLVFATIRASRVRAVTLGFDIYISRVLVFACGAAMAGIGGSMISSIQYVATPANFVTVLGLVWLAVAIAQGASSLGGLVMAGLLLITGPEVFGTILPWPDKAVSISGVMFGLLAINMVKDPLGINPQLRSQMRELAIKLSGGNRDAPPPPEAKLDDARVTAGV